VRQKQKFILSSLAVLIIGFIALQFVGDFIDEDFQRSNPPVTQQVQWDSPQTETLVRQACFDCHSNETQWTWYSYIAPVSWVIADDVNDGRAELNFSEPREFTPEYVQHMVDAIEAHTMPLPSYTLLHPDANLTDEQRVQLIDGIEATFGAGSMEEMDMED
jgi:hypothetical protein